jgi:hypothetical protein
MPYVVTQRVFVHALQIFNLTCFSPVFLYPGAARSCFQTPTVSEREGDIFLRLTDNSEYFPANSNYF